VIDTWNDVKYEGMHMSVAEGKEVAEVQEVDEEKQDV
jgi:hypothetical protein